MVKNLNYTGMLYPRLKTTYRLDLAGTNFQNWKFELYSVFRANNVVYVLTEAIPDKETDPVAHKKFLDDDFTARHIILGSLHDQLYMSYHRHQTAKSLLHALISFFTKPSISKRMLLLRRYVNHEMSEDTPVHEHELKMFSLAMELKDEGVNVPDELQAVFLMNSLPESWEDVVFDMTMDIDRDEKGLTLETVINRVKKTGALKELFKEREKAWSSSKNPKFRGKCYGCGETGHQQTDCPYEDDAL